MRNSINYHDVKHYLGKGGNEEIILDAQSEFDENALSATPKDGVSYLKEMGNNGILQKHIQW